MRVAVIGTGRMGRRHVRASLELGLDVVGVCDASDESLTVAAREARLPSEALFSDARELLSATRPDCVIVATTADSHAEFTCMAAESGARYVLCEKPMAVSIAECDRMIDACAARSVRLAVNHPRRFLAQFNEVTRTIRSEEFGRLTSMTVIGGNMGLAMNGCHYIEFFHYLTGDDPAEVSAWLMRNGPPNPRGPRFSDPGGSLRMETAHGQRFYIDIGVRQGHGIFVTYAGTHGLLVVDELAGVARLSVRDEEYRDEPSTRYGMPAVERAWSLPHGDPVALSREALRALLSGTDEIPTGVDGRRAVKVLVAAYLSDEGGHVPIVWDPHSLPRERVFPWA